MKNNKIIKIIFIIFMIVMIIMNIYFMVNSLTISNSNKLLGSVSHSDYLDSSNVTYLDSNVQDSIDNLYTQANDYTTLNDKIGTDKLTTTNQTLTGAINELNEHITLINNDIKIDEIYGTKGHEINIDQINNSLGYIYRIRDDGGYFSGTSPTSIIRGNGFLLIGFSEVNSNNLVHYGVQLAIGFGSSKIAIRSVYYNSTGTTWGDWTAIQ